MSGLISSEIRKNDRVRIQTNLITYSLIHITHDPLTNTQRWERVVSFSQLPKTK